MRKQTIFLVVMVVAIGIGPGDLRAQGSGSNADKVGFVDSLGVLYGTEVGKQEIAEVQSYLEEMQREYDSRRLELERKKEQFDTQQLTLNPTTRASMQREIEEDDRSLERFQEDTQVEITRQRDEILEQESGKIQEIINQYAQDRGYGAVFLLNETQIWIDPTLDLTAEIIRLYNERHPAGGAAVSGGAETPAQP